MFEDSFLDSRIKRRRWTTLISFLLEMLGLAALVLSPLLYTEALPNANSAAHISPPPAAPAPRPIQVVDVRHETSPDRSEVSGTTVVVPPSFPIHARRLHDDAAPPSLAPADPNGSVIGSTGPAGSTNPIIASMLNSTRPALPMIKPPSAPRQISNIDPGMLIRRVEPVYPYPAKMARIQGPVVLDAIIDKEGRIADLRLISGHPLLAKAALDAVSQWRYRPFILNREPVEVETRVTVNFVLAR